MPDRDAGPAPTIGARSARHGWRVLALAGAIMSSLACDEGTATTAARGDATSRVAARTDTVPTADSVEHAGSSVRHLRFHGPVQLVVGDMPQQLPVTAYDADGRPIALRGARVYVADSSLVAVDGLRLRARRDGASVVSVHAGGARATTGLHVYERVATLDGLAAAPRLVAVPLRLAQGEMRRWPLPWGGWLVSTWSAGDSAAGLRVRVAGARCIPATGLGPRHQLCDATDAATITVYVPARAGGRAGTTDTLVGTLALKPSGATRRDPR